MPFVNLKLNSFRNVSNAELSCDSSGIFLVGNNGQGKSNLLEAVYYLCYGSSFRARHDEHCIQTGAPAAVIEGTFVRDGFSRTIKITLQKGSKTILLDGKPIRDRRELMETVPCIVFCHEDIAFVRGGPENQRQFMNQSASLVYPGFLEVLRAFSKILKTRNFLLKEGSRQMLSAVDVQFVELGMELVRYRKKLMVEFQQTLELHLTTINKDLAGVSMHYSTQWKQLEREELLDTLASRIETDVKMGSSLWGPHRDKFSFIREGIDFMPQASTGQARLLSLLLRLTQASLVVRLAGTNPILLMDDVLLELDEEKRTQFMANMPDQDQSFFTFLPGASLSAWKQEGPIIYHVDEGVYREQNI